MMDVGYNHIYICSDISIPRRTSSEGLRDQTPTSEKEPVLISNDRNSRAKYETQKEEQHTLTKVDSRKIRRMKTWKKVVPRGKEQKRKKKTSATFS